MREGHADKTREQRRRRQQRQPGSKRNAPSPFTRPRRQHAWRGGDGLQSESSPFTRPRRQRAGVIAAAAALFIVLASLGTIVALSPQLARDDDYAQLLADAQAQAEQAEAQAEQAQREAQEAAEKEANGPFVQTETMYTYDEMVDDIAHLVARYPDLCRTETLGTSRLGRAIPLVVLGNPDAGRNIFVQSTIHAREYIASQTVMAMVERYCQSYESGSYGGLSFKRMLDSTCFYIVPMANPDGVQIAQTGSEGIASATLRKLIDASDHTAWKANAAGVDLNRNFPSGWMNTDDASSSEVTSAASEGYPGPSPLSEPETRALAELAQAREYCCYLSYHQAGNLIYYDEAGNTTENSEASTRLAQAVHDATATAGSSAYLLSSLKENALARDSETAASELAGGGFSDWVQLQLNKPAVTLELGRAGTRAGETPPGLPPAGQGEAGQVFEQNKEVWAAVAALYL